MGTTTTAKTQTTVRCAIYTRKSTTQGLEEDFTTLDAQRESCEAYIASQKEMGWRCIPTVYDDGGFTGANMERPALQDVLDDIQAGRIDCVVVYKVDRLSRSLVDFARLLQCFEEHDVTFVSVTQHFNTQTSMGRLTLNILLSFAQFEREMISERTRDKMGAARRKGKYLGGYPPLGYDVDRAEKRLIVNEDEAALVRTIFARYVRTQSLREVVQWLDARGHRQKRWTTRRGATKGGGPWTKTRLQYLLRNPLYIGCVRYQDEVYDGEQEAIVEHDLFTQVQARLHANHRARTSPRSASVGLLPRGLLRCGQCEGLLFHSHSSKGGRKYRYYVCSTHQKRGAKACGLRTINAPALEDAVVERLHDTLNDDRWRDRFGEALDAVRQLFTSTWVLLPIPERARILDLLLERVEYDGNGNLGFVLARDGVPRLAKELSADDGIAA